MADAQANRAQLERECARWCVYLIGQQPSSGPLARYLDAHAQGTVETPDCNSRFDRALVAAAMRGNFCTRLADAHARLFAPAGLLRRKLVLTLALLESDAAHHRRVDEVPAGSRAGFLLCCAAWSLRFVVLTVLGLLIFLPLRLVCSLRGARAEVA